MYQNYLRSYTTTPYPEAYNQLFAASKEKRNAIIRLFLIQIVNRNIFHLFSLVYWGENCLESVLMGINGN